MVRNFVVIQPITSTSSSQPITEYSVRPTTWRSRRRTVSASQADHHSWSRLLRPQQSPLSSVQRPSTTVAGGEEEQKNKETILRLAGQTPSLSCLHRPQQSPLSSVQRPPTTVASGKEEQKTKKQYQPLNYDKVLLLIRFISSNDSVSFKSYCDAHTEYLG